MRDNIFEEIASQYALQDRLSSDCIQSIIRDIAEQVTADPFPHLLDIGGGDGQFSSEFLNRTPVEECTIIDSSRRMLQKARENFLRLGVMQQVKLVQGDAHMLPLSSDRSYLVLMSFTLHLLSHPQAALLEVRRVLAPNGWFFLVTYDLLDLSSQVYHRYFPRWCEIDSQRHLEINALIRLMADCDLRVKRVSRYPYTIRHENVDELVGFVKAKPFSTVAKYSESEFQEAVGVFEKQLRLHFGSRPIEYTSKVTLISSIKDK